jgi:hypothetical protein
VGAHSLAFIVGAALSATLVVTIGYSVAQGLKSSSSAGSVGQKLDAALPVELVVLAAVVYHRRNQAKPPKWIGELDDAKPRFPFTPASSCSACFGSATCRGLVRNAPWDTRRRRSSRLGDSLRPMAA